MAYSSYESLPPDFTLLQNMAAGAFAGIAVSCPFQNPVTSRTLNPWTLGAFCHVSRRYPQGKP